ncbi:uncharacterized protein LOC134075278 [Sardina pilchardus]|uniref:uncharacterized protein LOC134075278 n=1 Tax=Sardina pilchardus TaxID=27697 RepID=UPI002E117FE1
MANKMKKPQTEEENVVGHIHSVSPIKTSDQNVQYFEAILQTGREDFNRVVVFASKKRNEFVQAADNRQAVRLVRVRKSFSFGNPGGFDVLVSSNSSVQVAEDLEFPRRNPTSAEELTVAQVLTLGPKQRVGTINVRVLRATAHRVVQVRETSCELRVFEVCDATGQTSLTVWDRLIVSVQDGWSYRFQTLATRKEGDRTVLTTTPSTTVTPTTEVGQPAVLRPVSVGNEEVVRGPVVGVKILAKPSCARCHTGQDNLVVRCTLHRCERCDMLQRTAAFIISYSGVLIVLDRNGEERSMSLTNSAIFAYVRDNFLNSSAHDGAALEESVMVLSEVEVTISCDGLVVCFGGTVAAKSSTEQERATGALVQDSSSTDQKSASDADDSRDGSAICVSDEMKVLEEMVDDEECSD